MPHHDPFQYYKSTANPKHLTPTSEAEIGKTDRANHNYDISDFFLTLKHGNLPSVSFLKPPAYQDAHAGCSDPLDEQTRLVTTINQIEKSPDWASTAIVVTYDDSDGWYDHQASSIQNGSDDGSLDTAMCMDVPVTLGSRNRPLRLRPEAAHARDLALDAAELRQPYQNGHGFGAVVHRGQLAG